MWGVGGKREGIVGEFGMDTYDMYPLLCLKWITNRNLLTVPHKDLCSMLCGCLGGRGV